MDKIALKATDICRIIDSCSSHGVKVLRYGDLNIEFNSKVREEVVTGIEPLGDFKEVPLSDLVDGQEGDLQMDVLDEQLAEDALHAQLLIDDPLAYEKSQMYAGLENSRIANEEI